MDEMMTKYRKNPLHRKCWFCKYVKNYFDSPNCYCTISLNKKNPDIFRFCNYFILKGESTTE